jgi:hypothetical protein
LLTDISFIPFLHGVMTWRHGSSAGIALPARHLRPLPVPKSAATLQEHAQSTSKALWRDAIADDKSRASPSGSSSSTA